LEEEWQMVELGVFLPVLSSGWVVSTAALLGVAYIGITPIIASYAQCATILDRIGAVPGTKGIMLIFPECLEGLQVFGEQVLPRMRTAKLAPPRPPRGGSVPLKAWSREYAYE